MEDKTFELLEKMYSEFIEFRKDANSKFDGVKSDIQGLKNDAIQIENKIDGLYDGYKQTYEKLEVIGNKVDALSV